MAESKTTKKPRFRDAYRASSLGTKILIFVLAIVAIFAFAMAVIYVDRRVNPGVPVNVERYALTVDGEVVCLPRVGTNEAHTLECRLGIRDDEGNHLKIEDGASYPDLYVGDIVRVNGIFEPADKDEVYDVSGTIYHAQIKTLAGRDNGDE